MGSGGKTDTRKKKKKGNKGRKKMTNPSYMQQLLKLMGKVKNLSNFFSGVITTMQVSEGKRPERIGFSSLKYTSFSPPDDMSRQLQWKTRSTMVKSQMRTDQILTAISTLYREGWAVVEQGGGP